MEKQIFIEGSRVICRPATSSESILFQSEAGWMLSLPGKSGSAHKDAKSGVVYVRTQEGSWALEQGRAHPAPIPKSARFMGVIA